MSKLEEGIHLIAYVTDKKSGESTTIEDYDYNSKKQFEQELKNNGYKVISILDNRDMFLLDNTNYTRVSQIQKELRQLKKDIEDSKDKYPALYKSYINDYNNLKDVYDKVMKISLTEGYVLKGIQDGKSFDISYNDSEEKLQKFKDEMEKGHKDIDMYIVKESKEFKYVDEEDIPRYDSYIGLQMQINWVKNRIKSLKTKISKDKYDADRNKHKHILEYYEELLNKYEDAMNNIKGLKEGTTIKAKYKPMVKDFYKTPTGTWMIDLNDGYVTSYGTNYIEAKTKTQCIYELENEVSQGEPGKSLFESNVIPLNKDKLEEVSRNELLVKTKGETITRYNKAASYKGFNIVNIYTDNLFKDNTLTIVLRVGKYNDVVQLEDVLYWIQIVAENKQGRQINTKGITEALMNAIDGMDIKIDCECRRFPL